MRARLRPARVLGAVTLNGTLRPLWPPRIDRSWTCASAGGWIAKFEVSTGPYEISVATSSSTGSLLPRASTAPRRGRPRGASHASSTAPSSPPGRPGATRTVYAGWPAMLPGVGPEMSSLCLRARSRPGWMAGALDARDRRAPVVALVRAAAMAVRLVLEDGVRRAVVDEEAVPVADHL